MKEKIHLAMPLLALFSIVIIELLLDYRFYTIKCWVAEFNYTNAILLMCIAFIATSWCINRDRDHSIGQVFKMLIKNTTSGNPWDLLFVFLFLLHLAWIPDAIFDWVKEPENYNFGHPLIFVLGLVAVSMIKQTNAKSTNTPTVLLTGISHISPFSLDGFCKPIREYHLTLKKVVIFADRQLKVNCKQEEIDLLPINEDLKKRLKTVPSIEFTELEELIKDVIKNINSAIEVEIEHCEYDEVKTTYEKIAQKVNKILHDNKTIDNKNLLFSVSPGTVNVGVAMAINSLKGDRQCYYIEQNGAKIGKTENLSIYTFKDSFEELT